MPLPTLPTNAAYLRLHNPEKRHALSFAVLADLRAQLIAALTSRVSGRLRILPPFQPGLLDDLERATRGDEEAQKEFGWLVDAQEWRRERAGLPDVLVLRSEGPVFCSGHDLKEVAELSSSAPDRVGALFALCANVMALLHRSPVPVVCPVQGLATAAGFQLALSTDFPIALATTPFCLPGARLGLPCTSPVTAVSRRVLSSPLLAYRLVATGDSITAADLAGAVDAVPVPEHAESTDTAAAAFEGRVAHVVAHLCTRAPQPQALGKWAYWTQLGLRTSGDGDGYEEAARWAGRVMALHARSEDAQEGLSAFFNKKRPVWISGSKL